MKLTKYLKNKREAKILIGFRVEGLSSNLESNIEKHVSELVLACKCKASIGMGAVERN